MPATYPTIANASGTTVGVTTSVPGSHDASGFGALSYTTIGQVVTPGSLPKEFREYTDVDLLDGTTLPVIGPKRMEDLNIETVFQGDDAGQAIIEANADGETELFFEFALPSGDKVYCAGYATNYGPTVDSPTGYVASNFTVKPIFDSAGNGVVRVAAA